jgi:hypothetical protein
LYPGQNTQVLEGLLVRKDRSPIFSVYHLFQVRVRHENQIGVNRYGRGLYDYTFEICEIAEINVPILKVFFKKTALDLILKQCPYQAVSDTI